MTRPYLHTFDPARYSKFYLLECVPEEQAQAAVLESLRWRGIPAVAVDAGAKKLRGRAYGALKAAGRGDLLHRLNGQTGAGVAGLVDIIGTVPGALLGRRHGVPLFIEMKAPQHLMASPKTGAMIQKEAAGKPTPQQLAFLDTMHQAGAAVGVCWSVPDMELILTGLGLALL